jgi:hypothetical protein
MTVTRRPWSLPEARQGTARMILESQHRKRLAFDHQDAAAQMILAPDA